jgi:hypothetical protein
VLRNCEKMNFAVRSYWISMRNIFLFI